MKNSSFPSRCAMQLCCKKKSPTLSQWICVKQDWFRRDSVEIHIWDHEKLYTKIRQTETEIVDIFLKLINNTESKFEEITLDLLFHERGNGKFMEILMEKLGNRKHYIKTHAFSFERNGENEKFMLEFFKKLHPDYLRKLYLVEMPSKEIAMEMVKTEQWKNLKEISVGGTKYIPQNELTIPMESILIANSLIARASSFQTEEIFDVVKNFQTTDRPVGSFFLIEISYLLDPVDLCALVGPVVHELRNTRQTVVLYPMKDDTKMLLVEFRSFEVRGLVCEKVDSPNLNNFRDWLVNKRRMYYFPNYYVLMRKRKIGVIDENMVKSWELREHRYTNSGSF